MHQNAELQNKGAAVLAPHGAFGFVSVATDLSWKSSLYYVLSVCMVSDYVRSFSKLSRDLEQPCTKSGRSSKIGVPSTGEHINQSGRFSYAKRTPAQALLTRYKNQ